MTDNKIKNNKKYQRIFCAPKTESFCGFESPICGENN